MDLTTITIDQFMCSSNASFAEATPVAFDELNSAIGKCIGPKLRDLGRGYELFQLSTDAGDVVLRYSDENIGFYCGELLVIHEDHRGKGLGVALVLAAVPNRNLPAKRVLSRGGDIVLRRSWRVANGLEPDPWP